MDETTLNMLSWSIGASSYDTSMMLDPSVTGMLWTLWTVINILSIIMYLGSAIWLYLINKKLGEKYAWLSFIPLIQIYNYFTASKKPVKQYLVYPILAIILNFLIVIILNWLLLIWRGNNLSIFITIFWFLTIISFIYFLIMWIKLLHAISLRTWNWVGTTIWFMFISSIMLPIVWIRMKEQTENNNPVETTNSNTNKINNEWKIINDNEIMEL